MASDCIVPVVEISNIREHPGASLLSICEVLGYQMVNGLVEDPEGPLVRHFRRGERDARGRRIPWDQNDDCERAEDYEEIRYNFRYSEGSRAVYFPADTVLTDELAKRYEVDHLLKSGNRVGRARLRGEPSFGLVVEIPAGKEWELGQNVAEHYDVQKYVPPPRNDPGDIAPYDSDIDPHFVTYTDIQNGLLLYDKFQEGEEVVATEKIHGANCRIGMIDGKLVAGSRTTRKADIPDGGLYSDFLFWSPLMNDRLAELLETLSAGGSLNVILFGEVYGQGVQSLHYGVGGKKAKGFRAFDIYVGGDFWSYDMFEETCEAFGIETAPVLYRGPFDLEKIKEVSNGKSTLPGADNIREGVVVRPAKERRDPALGRVCLKFISPEYDLSKHKKKDTTDL